MILKKILTSSILGLAIVGSSTIFAGGVETPPAPTFSGIYLEGNAGYAYRDWRNLEGTPFEFFSTNNNRGGFSAIVDLGYQFNQYISLETGWIHLPRVNGISREDFTGETFFHNGSISSWALYLAGKLTVPIYQDVYLFGKLGAAYVDHNGFQCFSTDGTSFGDHSTDYWTPMFAFGVQYYFTPNVSINFQYTRLPGYFHLSSTRFAVPDADIFTLGAGYKFLT